MNIIVVVAGGAIGCILRYLASKIAEIDAEMDASVSRSGQSGGAQGHMSKRGSSQLCYALMLAADRSKAYDPYFKDYYESTKARGKHHYAALPGVARKLAGSSRPHGRAEALRAFPAEARLADS